jgi:hypothetical protein
MCDPLGPPGLLGPVVWIAWESGLPGAALAPGTGGGLMGIYFILAIWGWREWGRKEKP